MSVVHGTAAGRNLSTLKKYLMVVTNLYLLCKRKKDGCENRMLVITASAIPLLTMGFSTKEYKQISSCRKIEDLFVKLFLLILEGDKT